jgi:hypothetical protein
VAAAEAEDDDEGAGDAALELVLERTRDSGYEKTAVQLGLRPRMVCDVLPPGWKELMRQQVLRASKPRGCAD